MTWFVRLISLQYGFVPFGLLLLMLWYCSKIPKGMGTKHRHRAPMGAGMEYEQH